MESRETVTSNYGINNANNAAATTNNSRLTLSRIPTTDSMSRATLEAKEQGKAGQPPNGGAKGGPPAGGAAPGGGPPPPPGLKKYSHGCE